MGYTNYWTIADKTASLAKRKQMAIFAKFAIDLSEVCIKGGDGTGKPELTEEHIWLNGNGEGEEEEDHETFGLAMTQPKQWDFCKTIRKPYDEVVKACLIYAKELGIIQGWDFDGEEDEEEYLVADKLKKEAERATELLTSGV